MLQVGPDARGRASLLGCTVFGVQRPAEAAVMGVLVAHASRRMVQQHFPPPYARYPMKGALGELLSRLSNNQPYKRTWFS